MINSSINNKKRRGMCFIVPISGGYDNLKYFTNRFILQGMEGLLGIYLLNILIDNHIDNI